MLVAAALVVGCGSSSSVGPGRDLEAGVITAADDELLAAVEPDGWRRFPGTTEQYFPLFIGASPRELALGVAPATQPRVAGALRELGEAQARAVVASLGVRDAELEVWPTQDWSGQPNWVFARWRAAAGEPWRWLTTGNTPDAGRAPMLPMEKDPSHPDDHAALFGDFLTFDDLYQQPAFGNCVWVARESGALALAWPDTGERMQREPELARPGGYVAYCVNQPPRFNGPPLAFAIAVRSGDVEWPSAIDWVSVPAPSPAPVTMPLQVTSWPADFAAAYERDVRIVDGEADAVFPLSHATARFVRRGSFQEDNDLGRVVDYLEERYEALGFVRGDLAAHGSGNRFFRQRFTWRGITQSNLVVVIEGTEHDAPVVLADHIDAACEEDTFAATGRRVTTRGADDNATATAVLLRAAEILKDSHPRRDVWLLHLTGEEFPSDGLGSRHFVIDRLDARQDFRAVIVPDFIGWHQPDERLFQISPTSVPGSEHLAALALDAADAMNLDVQPVYRARDVERNSVFQTDLQEFEYLGWPGILFNENMNYANFEGSNPNYHQSTDVAANVDFGFATAVAKIIIETTLRAANED